ncbi:hypothetical protein K3G69_26670 [Phytobacter diazotrophicus]|uniref:hypothetical protein n=1 Tax=Phytobacter diazotrophicus TaxID=395631 RepID=UPI001C99BB0E|nr:hypothetical protein [Phytobacter diazotrophicus]MBY6260062.1 hypothetical protein [Phytobacter diazotrophicus]
MPAKPVTLAGVYYARKGDAECWLMAQRDAVETQGGVSQGPLFDQLKDLFLRYCQATDWPLKGDKVTHFTVGYEHRGSGDAGGSTKCFFVHFDNDDEGDSFSVPTALKSVLSQQGK